MPAESDGYRDTGTEEDLMTLAVVALVTWALTAVGGGVMLGRWLARRGTRRAVDAAAGRHTDVAHDLGVGTGTDVARGDPGTRLPAQVAFGHAGLAGLGLLVWIGYLVTGSDPLAWTGVVLLIAVVLLGLAMFLRWIAVRRTAARTAEADFPLVLVYGHGLLAVATLVLGLLAALGVG
jgi:hypothetical protein